MEAHKDTGLPGRRGHAALTAPMHKCCASRVHVTLGQLALVQLGAADVDTETFAPRKCGVRRQPTSLAECMS